MRMLPLLGRWSVSDAVERVTCVGEVFKSVVSVKDRRAPNESVELISRLVVHNNRPFVPIYSCAGYERHVPTITAENRDTDLFKIPALAVVYNDCPRFGDMFGPRRKCHVPTVRTKGQKAHFVIFSALPSVHNDYPADGFKGREGQVLTIGTKDQRSATNRAVSCARLPIDDHPA
jgi:hypothetical protein